MSEFSIQSIDWWQTLFALNFGFTENSEHAQKPLVNLGVNEAFASCHRSVTGGF